MERRRAAAGLAAAVVVIILGFFVLRGSGGEEEVLTDVAVHVGTVGRATLHRYVTAYGYVEPEPAGGGDGQRERCSPPSSVASWQR